MKKKILSLGLVTIVLASTVACSDQTKTVDEEDNNMNVTQEDKKTENKEQDTKVQTDEQEIDSKYQAHRGNISEISQEDGTFYVTVDNENKEEGYGTIKFNVSDETQVLDDKTRDFMDTKELKEGSTVEAFYEQDSPMTRSIPPMTNAKAIIMRENTENQLGIKIDTFDSDFISSDNSLQLNITKDTKIVDKEGKELTKEDVVDKESIVFYGPAMTMSIPGQSNAVKIIVLTK